MKSSARTCTKRIMTLGACIGLTMVVSGTAHAQLVTNGSFENPGIGAGGFQVLTSIPGWSLAYGDGMEVQRSAAGAPFEGAQHVELDAFTASGIFQDISTTSGDLYRLTFAFSARPGTGAADNVLEIQWGGVIIDTLTANGTGQSNTVWQTFNYDLLASGPTMRLQFGDRGASNGLGTYLDAVSLTSLGPVVSAPEPGSIALALVGSIGLIGTVVRRRKA